MSPFVILFIGMVVVVGGILGLRLHAFLALVAGALTVALLTPFEARESFHRQQVGVAVRDFDEVNAEMMVNVGKKDGVQVGDQYLVRQKVGRWRWQSGEAMLYIKEVGDSWSKVRIGPDPSKYEHQPTDLAVTVEDELAIRKSAGKSIGERVAQGFGTTSFKIGIIIAMAAIIGACLLESGAAQRIVEALMSLFGEKRAAPAFVASGFLLGIPVFFDTVFYLLIPLGKAARRKTGRNYLLYVLSIVAGGTMAHSLVPPTPGPLAVAGELKVELGTMIIGGCIVGLITATVGYLFALWINQRMVIDLPDDADDKGQVDAEGAGDAIPDPSSLRLPPLWLSLAPIILPVVLIAASTVVSMVSKNAAKAGEAVPQWVASIKPTIDVIGNKNVALILAAAVAMVTLVVYRKLSRKGLAESVQRALMSGGVIILITAAGGAFGGVLRQTDIAAELEGVTGDSKLLMLPLAFILTTLIRTAQGSATVAMITAAGIVSAFVSPEALGYHPVYIALAIGCGSKPISWMNDSGFWIISKMSGMTEGQTLRTVTIMSALMGVTGLLATMLGAMVLPMV